MKHGKIAEKVCLRHCPIALKRRHPPEDHTGSIAYRRFPPNFGSCIQRYISGRIAFKHRPHALPAGKRFAVAVGDISGQVIVIGTDGIWEAHNPQREMFGKDRLRAVIRDHHDRNAHAIKDAVFSAVAEFTGPDQDDDITLAVIKVL